MSVDAFRCEVNAAGDPFNSIADDLTEAEKTTWASLPTLDCHSLVLLREMLMMKYQLRLLRPYRNPVFKKVERENFGSERRNRKYETLVYHAFGHPRPQ